MANKTLPMNSSSLWNKLYHSEIRNHGDNETDYAKWLKEQMEKGEKNEKGNKERKSNS
jgi:hypothetical protein